MNKCVILILCFFRLKNEEEMLSVENEFLDVEGLNPEENAKDGHSLNNGSELTSKFTPQAQLESRGKLLGITVSIGPRHITPKKHVFWVTSTGV